MSRTDHCSLNKIAKTKLESKIPVTAIAAVANAPARFGVDDITAGVCDNAHYFNYIVGDENIGAGAIARATRCVGGGKRPAWNVAYHFDMFADGDILTTAVFKSLKHPFI